MQLTAWYVSLFFMSLLIVMFAVVFSRSGERIDYEPIQKKGYKLRRYYFLVILAVLFTGMGLSLPHLPYSKPASAEGEPLVVQVNASQFSWEMSTQKVKAGQLIEFDVTSKDVNHGFGIYDETMQIVTQVQAMPGYTNKLYYTFSKPGKYKILCLEYCGVAHHYMMADFEVVPANQ